jgi:hypothetical protein
MEISPPNEYRSMYLGEFHQLGIQMTNDSWKIACWWFEEKI